MNTRKGIILAGGSGTRLWPITLGVSKQLLPVYDKPMIYYPLSALMLADIREIAIITTPEDQAQFQRLMGDGSQWGLEFTWIIQPSPDGLAQAYLLAEDFLGGSPSLMVLGDNIFFGHGLPEMLARADARPAGGTVFGYRVADPERYGVVDFDAKGRVRAIIEKPEVPPSNYAVTGLYCLDGTAPAKARRITPSARGELEITSLLELYLAEGRLSVETMGRGYAWLDTGTHESLLDAGNFVRTLEQRQGLQIGSPDEIAHAQGWIDRAALAARAKLFGKNAYGAYLKGLERGGDPVAHRHDRQAALPAATPMSGPVSGPMSDPVSDPEDMEQTGFADLLRAKLVDADAPEPLIAAVLAEAAHMQGRYRADDATDIALLNSKLLHLIELAGQRPDPAAPLDAGLQQSVRQILRHKG